VRAALRPADPTLALTEIRVIQELVDHSVSARRMVSLLLVGFAGFAAILASLGIYGVISYGVTQRAKEIGIRIALGESAGTVQRRVLGQTARLAGYGMAVGIAGSWAVGRLLETLLFGVGASDLPTYMTVTIILGAVAALAGVLPARRASRVDPIDALRAG